MLARVAEIFVIVNVTAAALGYLGRRWRTVRRERNIDHVRRLEQENKELDEVLKRMHGDV